MPHRPNISGCSGLPLRTWTLSSRRAITHPTRVSAASARAKSFASGPSRSPSAGGHKCSDSGAFGMGFMQQEPGQVMFEGAANTVLSPSQQAMLPQERLGPKLSIKVKLLASIASEAQRVGNVPSALYLRRSQLAPELVPRTTS